MSSEVNLEAIQKAHQRIQQLVRKTPVMNSVYLEERLGYPVYLKLENLNKTGSFKIRGASNWMLAQGVLPKGVVAASAGNHAQGVAYVSQKLQVPATIFMPEGTPIIKVESTRMMGAKIVLAGETYTEAFDLAKAHADKHSLPLIQAFADPLVICGQGTAGLEVLDSCPDIKAVFVPIGGGGLMSGVACAVKSLRPDIRVYGVQSAAFPSMAESFRGGHIKQVTPSATIADGIAVKKVSELNFGLIQKYVDDIFVVQEKDIAASILDLMERNHLLAEGAGAAAIAGLLDADPEIRKAVKGQAVCCILSGGNIDVNLLQRVTTQGLIRSGRLMRMRCRVPDRPGSLAHLLQQVANTGANIVEVHHDRFLSENHYKEVTVDMTLETINPEHQSELKDALEGIGIKFQIMD